jgi:formamidopyrimidine-DNA glycosylase
MGLLNALLGINAACYVIVASNAVRKLVQNKATGGICKRAYSRSSLYMMPEGPEVRSLTDSMGGMFGDGSWRLTQASVISGRYSKVQPSGWSTLIQKLPVPVRGIRSRGKFIYLDCGEVYIFNTLGLSGGWTLSPRQSHIRVALELETTTPRGQRRKETLFFYDKIGYGTLKVSSSRQELDDKLSSFHLSWLEDRPSFEEFWGLLKKCKPTRPLAVFLMDQGKIAGIGNYILSEVLYRAEVHPWALCGQLDVATSRELYRAIATVISSSYLSQQNPAQAYYTGLIGVDGKPLTSAAASLSPVVAVQKRYWLRYS